MPDAPAYPPAPWHMHAQLWLSVLRVPRGPDARRPAGLYGVAVVDYAPPSPLTYSELLVGRVVRKPLQAVTITDIWVDSPASVAGGRALWAIPKDLGEFAFAERRRGLVTRTTWAVGTRGREFARACFDDVSRFAPRTPFAATTWQPGIAETGFADRSSPLRGSGRALPARGRWQFDPEGPLGWLDGSRILASFRMSDVTMVVD